MVSLETLETQPLLDHADTSLDFVTRKDIVPISIERLNGEFLLHYTDFSFFVNRNGWRARPDWLINWEGKPTSFALSHPYLLAFEPNFIEIRHLETSQLVHIITAKNIRMLHSSTREVGPALQADPTKLADLVGTDFVRLRRRGGRGYCCELRLLEQTSTIMLLITLIPTQLQFMFHKHRRFRSVRRVFYLSVTDWSRHWLARHRGESGASVLVRVLVGSGGGWLGGL